MDKWNKIALIGILALLLIGAGWNNIFKGVLFDSNYNLGSLRVASYDETNDLGGTVRVDTLKGYIEDNFEIDSLSVDYINLTDGAIHDLEIVPTGVYLNDVRVTYFFKGFAGFTENTDSVVITDTDAIYRFPGNFSNNLNGFEIGTYGIKYLGGDTLRMLVTGHAYVKFSAPNTVMYFGAQLILESGDTIQSMLEPVKGLTADQEYLILFEGNPNMPPNSEIELICKADKAGTYTPSTCKVRIREW